MSAGLSQRSGAFSQTRRSGKVNEKTGPRAYRAATSVRCGNVAGAVKVAKILVCGLAVAAGELVGEALQMRVGDDIVTEAEV